MKLFFCSMTGRIFLIIMGGVFVSAALSLWIATYERESELTQIHNLDAAIHVAQLVLMMDATPIGARPAIAAIAHRIGLYASFTYPPDKQMNPDPEFSAVLAQKLGTGHEVRAFKNDQAE